MAPIDSYSDERKKEKRRIHYTRMIFIYLINKQSKIFGIVKRFSWFVVELFVEALTIGARGFVRLW